LVICGDFNCPFNALANDRAARLEGTGLAIIVDWRAVEHDRTIPPGGSPVDTVWRRDFEQEIDVVREQLRPGEALVLQPPAVFINTATLNASYAARASEDPSRVRQRLFHSYQCDGTHMDDPAVTTPAWPPRRIERASRVGRKRSGRRSTGRSPAMLIPVGGVSRGLGVLARLADNFGQPGDPTEPARWTPHVGSNSTRRHTCERPEYQPLRRSPCHSQPP